MRHLLLAAVLLLSACGAALQPGATADNTPPRSGGITSLEQRSSTFLYLAAEDAIHQGEYELAIQFLSALLRKNPDADEPRLQLVELLLSVQRTTLAAGYLKPLLDKTPLRKGISDEQLRVHVLHARLLASKGESDSALDLLLRILQVKPTLLSARMLQASIYAGQQRFDMAEAAIAAGIKSGDSPALRKAQAELFLRQKKVAEARRALQAMRKLAPDDETPILMLANLAIQQKQVGKAEQLLRSFLTTHPQAYRSKNMLGRLLVQEERFEEAITVYLGLARDTGDEPDVLSALGLLYFQNKQYDKAAAQFRKILQNRPDGSSHYYLGACLEAMDKKEEASHQYSLIGENDPIWIDAQLRLASIDFTEKRFASAEKRAKSLLKKQPKLSNAYLILSAVYLVQERFRELLEATKPAMALTHIPSRLLLNRAVALEHFKDYDELEATLKQLLANDPDNAEALNFLGYTYAEQGIKLDEAERLIRRSLKHKPDDGYHLDSLAWVYYQRGDYRQAAEIQSQAIKAIPNDPIMQEHMGDMQWKLGHHDAARDYWNRAIQFGHKAPADLRRKINKGL